MLKRLFKYLLWILADSERMPIRRIGWKILKLYENIFEDHKYNLEFTYPELDDTKKSELLKKYNNLSKVESSSRILNDTLISGTSLQEQSRIVFVIHALPKHDRNSSSLRIFYFLKALSEQVASLDLVYEARGIEDPLYRSSLPKNISTHRMPLNHENIGNLISKLNATHIIFSELFSLAFIEKIYSIIQKLKPNHLETQWILDTMDCHWKKYVRKAKLSNENIDWNLAWQYLDIEQLIYPLVDKIILVTKEEVDAVKQSVTTENRYLVVPNCNPISSEYPVFSETHDLCFVGSAAVNHNLDAMIYFRDHIMSALREKVAGVNIYIIGTGWQEYRKYFSDDIFIFIGHVKNLEKEMSKYRVFVCPLTYGAGLKGKLGSAASSGIPVVTSSIGAEGYPIRKSSNWIIADTPESFVQACCVLLEDDQEWETQRQYFRKLVDENFGYGRLQKLCSSILS